MKCLPSDMLTKSAAQVYSDLIVGVSSISV